MNDLPHNEIPLRMLTKVENKLIRAKPQELTQEKLHDFMDDLQLGLIRISDSINKAYF
jgi:hypothetical protein